MLTEVVQLVRFAIGVDTILEPFDSRIEQSFNSWIDQQKKRGCEYGDEQLSWLKLIKNHIAANAEITPKDFMEIPSFVDLGGLIKVKQLFGQSFDGLIDELQEVLVA